MLKKRIFVAISTAKNEIEVTNIAVHLNKVIPLIKKLWKNNFRPHIMIFDFKNSPGSLHGLHLIWRK